MADFYVVRHSEVVKKSRDMPSIYGSIDNYLAPSAHQQSVSKGRLLAQLGVTFLYAPPLQRTVGTARAMQRETGGMVVIDDALVGRNMGGYALGGHKAMKDAALQTYVTIKGTTYYTEVLGAESLDALFDRIKTDYQLLVARHAKQLGSIILVTQHVTGTLLRGVHDGLSLNETLEYEDLSFTDVVRLRDNEPSIGVN